MKTKRTQIILATLNIALTLSAVSAWADMHRRLRAYASW